MPKINIQIEYGEDPKEIFKKIADREAEIESAKNYQRPVLPVYQKQPKVKKNVVGWLVFFKELRP